jgi:hypothetical protein
MLRFVRVLPAALAIGAVLTVVVAGSVAAHVQLTVGTYKVALGWANEPTYVGELNAVEVIVSDQAGNPVTDLGSGDLTVTVTAGGQTSEPLALAPAFDTEEGTGIPGDYRADLIPTIPGDYTFHLTGTIHGQAVDETATSAPDTFDSPSDPTAAQFPDKVPSVSELATRIDRVDSRSAADAQQALLVGGGLGLAGVVIGVAALALAFRTRRLGTGG